MSNFKIDLGAKVRHKVHGFEGTVTARSEHLHACVIYIVQSAQLKDGRPIEAESFDEDSLEVTAPSTRPGPSTFKFELGSKVRDTVTGFTGLVTIRTDWLAGLRRYALKPTILHDGKPIEAMWADEGLLEVVEAAEPHVMRKTGGPGDLPQRARDVERSSR